MSDFKYRDQAHLPKLSFLPTLFWLTFFFTLTYKQKILGEIGNRPLYLKGIMFSLAFFLYLYIAKPIPCNLRWRSRDEPLLLTLLLWCILYVSAQSLAYPSSINAVLYSTTTAFLCLALSFISSACHGWKTTTLSIYLALLGYSMINIFILGGGIFIPKLLLLLPTSPLDSGFGIRISGFPGDPTHLGALFSITLLFMYLIRPLFSKWWNLPVSLILLAALLATGTRNAVLSLLIGMLIVNLHRINYLKLAKMGVLGIVVVAISGILTYLLFPEAPTLFSDLFRLGDENAYSRLAIWMDMADIAFNLNSFEILVGGGFLFIQDIYGSPYNAFLRIFFNHGLLMTAVFISTVGMLFFKAANEPDHMRRRITLALLAYWASFSFFLDTSFAEFFHLSEFLFWLSAGLITSTSLKVTRGSRGMGNAEPQTTY